MNVDLSDFISLQLPERGTRLDTRHESLAYCPTESEHVADGHLMFRELNPQQNTVTHFIDSITMKALQKSTEYRVFVHEKQYEYERRRLIEQERITELSYFLNSLEFIERGEKCEAKAIIDYFTAGFPQVKYFEESRQMMDIIKEEEVEQWGNMFENIGSEKEKIILEVVAEPHCRNQIYENEEEYRVRLHDNSTKESDGITHFLSEQRALDAVNKMFFFFREEESQRLQLEMETVGGNIESAICKANKTVESGKPQYRRQISKKTMKCVKWMWYEEVLPFQWNNGILELINLLEDNETAGRQKIIEEFSTSYRSLESIETHDILLIISFWAKANNISQNRLNELLFPPGQNMDDKGRNHPFSSRDLQGVLRAIPYIVQEEEALRAKIVLCEDMVFDAKSFMFHYETTDGKDYVFLNYEEGSIRKNIYALYCKMTADLFYYYIDEQRNIFIRHLMSAGGC